MSEFFSTLYKRDRSGGVRIWYLELDGNRYRTHSGVRDGVVTQTGWTTCYPKNVGKKNATTDEEQALSEVNAEYAKKLERGYFESAADIDNPVPHKPMLAHKYQDLKKPLDFTANIYTQPKLDGIRCIAKADGLWTRTGKSIKGAPHIFEALRPVFDARPDLILDGELYNHSLKDDFNEIVSNVRKTKPTAEDLARSRDLVQYHIYDQDVDDTPFYTRYQQLIDLLREASQEGIVAVVETYRVHSQEDLDKYFEDFSLGGYEGQIIRLNAEYENTRSWNLLKRKEFDDAEFSIVRIEEGNGNWAGYAKRVVVYDPLYGREQPCGLKGSQAFAKELLECAPSLVGTEVTVRYFRRTPDGYLRMPVVQDVHGGKRDD